jgi:hypothetical protein
MFESGGFGGSATGTVAATPAGAPADASAASGDGGLARAIDALLAVDPDGVSDGELAASMLALRREQARLAAVVGELTAVFETRRVYAGDGSRSATDWIAVHARSPRGQVADEVRDARRLRSMPLTRDAFRAGDITAAHVRALARLAGHPRAGVHFPNGEAHLVDQARRLRFDDWQRLCDHWRDAADPDGPEQRHGRDRDLRRFRIAVGLDGVGHADGYLTPVAAATVDEGLRRIEADLFAADWDAAKKIHGDATTVAHLARTSAQRRHDALVEMAIRATTAPADGKRPAPLVTVMVGYETFAGRICELAAGTVVAPGAVAELLGRDDTLIERVVGDGTNRIVDISSARSFRGTLRRVLDIVHRRCDHKTCFVPASRCQGDHVVAWSHGGLTAQDNGRLGCPPHNRWWYATGQSARPPGDPPPRAADQPDARAPEARPPQDRDDLDEPTSRYPRDPRAWFRGEWQSVGPVDLRSRDVGDPDVPDESGRPRADDVTESDERRKPHRRAEAHPRIVLRIACAPERDVHCDVGGRRHTIDLHPSRGERRWRDYAVGSAA